MTATRTRSKRLGNRFDKAGSLEASAKGEAEERVAGEQLWWPPGGSAGVIVTEQSALQYAALLATIEVLSTDTAILPLRVMQTSSDDTTRVAKEHPCHELMTRSPNGEATPIRWRQSWMSHALTFGSGFAEIQRMGGGRPYGLHLLDPVSTRPERDPDRRLLYRIGGSAAGSRTLPPENVLHIAGLGYDGLTGYNMIKLLRQSIGLGIAGDTFAADFFSNGAESGGVIRVPGRLKDEDAVTRLTNRWEGRHQGAGRRHRTAVLEEGASYEATSTDPEKSQLNESRKFQVLDTIRPWRVPPNKVGDYSEAHLANLEQSNLDYLMTALMGWLVVVEQECNLKLLTRKEWQDGYHFLHDTSAFLRGDIKTRYESYAAAIRDGWKNRDQVRKEEGLNPMGPENGGDLYTVQMQIVPLVKVEEEEEEEQVTEPEPKPEEALKPEPDPETLASEGEEDET